MKYSTKLYLSIVSLTCSGILFAVGIEQYKTRQFTYLDLQTKVVSTAATIASQLNGDELKKIKTVEDANLPAYNEIRIQLRKARDANKQAGVNLKFIYTTMPNPKDPKKFIFGVDPEEAVKDYSPIGTDNPGATDDKLYEHLNEPYTSGLLTTDSWGTWLTGYAPVYDKTGQYVATVGVDLGAQFVKLHLDSLLIYGAVAVGASFIISILLAQLLANRVTRSLRALQIATVELAKGNLNYRILLKTSDEFQELADSMNTMSEGLEEKERLKSGFARYVSQHVLEKIVKSKGTTKLEGERKKITVFFSDIRNFTRISESMPPEKLMAFLNTYFEKMLDIIFKHNGMLDKLLGDGIMAEFGVPVEDAQQERNAVITALEMISALNEINETWIKEGKPPINIGIGIHTGDAIVGSLGSEQRMQYTAIGDTVNIAERLQEVTKEQKYPIIVSESTFNALYNEFPTKYLGALTLHGKEHPINAYAVFPIGTKPE